MRILTSLIVFAGPVLGAVVGVYLTDRSALDTVPAGSDGVTGFDALSQHAAADAEKPPDVEERSYVKIGRQIIIPVVNGGETESLMLFELAVDVPAELSERVHTLEPRLRDAFLSVLLRMSSTGAFNATYTETAVLDELRRELLRAARRLLGEAIQDVLVLDVIRQEI